jgi:DNA-binding MarR family transcriptional regulator
MQKNKKPPTALPTYETMPVKHKLIKVLWVLGPAFTRWAESHMHEKHLTPQRVRLMWPLIENGPQMMSALRDELGVSATNVTALVDALEKDGMVTRKPHDTDRRATLIAITPKAEKMLIEKCGEFHDEVASIFSGFTKAAQEQLLALLLQVREALIKQGMLEDCELCAGPSSKSKKK